MQYVTLSNGVKMPILGYGVYQITKGRSGGDRNAACVLLRMAKGMGRIPR